MENDFWSLIGDIEIQETDRTLEVLRRCSSVEVFRAILKRIKSIIHFVREKHKNEELIIDGLFRLKSDWLYYDGMISKIVMADITIEDLKGKVVFKSEFYMVVTISGRITSVFDTF